MMKFILTIDTEGDNQWDHGIALTSENIRFIPRFQELCNKFSVKPTYLVTSEICEDVYARMIFSEYISNDLAEIGTHLHSWTTPPFLDKDGFRFNDPQHIYASELPEELLEMKLQNITDQIESAFGKRPLSYRSGRYGFNEFIAQSLANKNYLVDTSVTPYTDWTFNKGLSTGHGGPDFLEKTPHPYVYEYNKNYLVEIPVTVLPVAFPLNKSRAFAIHYFRNVDKSFFLKVLRKILFKNQPLWLRPFDWVNINMFETLLKEAFRNKLPYIVMMFHSSELMPGCSMYWKDGEAIDRLYTLLTDFFKLLNQNNIPSLTLTEAAKEFIKENDLIRK
jgi:hypothetical protein